MAGERILIIDDAEGVRKLLQRSLAQEGFRVSCADSGESGLETAGRELPDLIVLDLMLPGIDGLAVCRQLKEEPRTASIPIIMLTGRDEESDVISCLDMGADDYLVKPCSPRLLAARMRAVWRRRGAEGPVVPALQLYDLTIDPLRGEVRSGTTEVFLSLPEFRFLHLLVAAALAADGRPDRQLLADHGADPDDQELLVLEREGLGMWTLNRLGRLAPLLVGLPGMIVCGHPWLALFAALARIHQGGIDPRLCLEAARQGFVASGAEVGELLASAQLLRHLSLCDNRLERLQPLLDRAVALTRQVLPRLSVNSQLHVTQCLAFTATFGATDVPVAAEFTERALSLVEQHGLAPFGVAARGCRGQLLLRQGGYDSLRRKLEELQALLPLPQVSPIDRALVRLLQLQLLMLEGDAVNFQRLRADLIAEAGGPWMERSLLQPALAVLEGAAAIGAGRWEEALALGRLWGDDCSGLRPEAWRVYFLAMQTLAAAGAGETSEAKTAGRKTAELLLTADPWQAAWSGLWLGEAWRLLGVEAARSTLAGARAAADALGNGWLAAMAQALTATLAVSSRDLAAPAELLAWSKLARGFGLSVLPCSARRIFLDGLLAAGLGNGPVVARLAETLGLAVNDEGSVFPTLDLRTLGGCEVRIWGRRVLGAEDFSPAQRELLALLVATPGMKLSQEEVQLEFWPDSTPEKARSSFDSLLLRLRKTLDQALYPLAIKDCLVLQKGILSLQQVQVDAHTFRTLARRGLDHVRHQEFWAAENAFARAQALWAGTFMPGASSRDQSADFREELERLHIETSGCWADLLIDSGRTELAAELLRLALRLDRTNDALVRTLCRSHLRSNNPTQAKQVLRLYETNLRRENFPSEEIRQILDTFPGYLRSSDPP